MEPGAYFPKAAAISM